MANRKPKAKEKRVVSRSGRIPKLTGVYPKRYEIEIADNDGKGVTISRRCVNMTGWELYGVLHMAMREIERQLTIRPEEQLTVTEQVNASEQAKPESTPT